MLTLLWWQKLFRTCSNRFAQYLFPEWWTITVSNGDWIESSVNVKETSISSGASHSIITSSQINMIRFSCPTKSVRMMVADRTQRGLTRKSRPNLALNRNMPTIFRPLLRCSHLCSNNRGRRGRPQVYSPKILEDWFGQIRTARTNSMICTVGRNPTECRIHSSSRPNRGSTISVTLSTKKIRRYFREINHCPSWHLRELSNFELYDTRLSRTSGV
jgi:hypothetical protein